MPSFDLDTLDHIAAPVFVVGVEPGMRLEFRLVNAAHTAISGLTTEDVRGKTAVELFDGRAGKNAWHRHAQVAETGKPLDYVITLPFKSGERAFRTALVPVKDDSGAVTAIVGTMTEITAQRALETSHLMSEAASTDWQNEAEQFVSMAAHDLRAPMRNVGQIAAMLREDFVDNGDGKLELIEMLGEIGEKASRMISDVLAYSKATSTEERSSVFQLGALCSDIFAILDPDNCHALSNDDAWIETDEVAMQIVLRNLVDNALQHSEKDRVSLFVGFDGEDGGQLSFMVRDNGCGLEDPAMAFLSSGKFTYDTGFGMLGVRRLIVSRGGNIFAEAPPHGIGTLIRFTLPGRIMSAPNALVADHEKFPAQVTEWPREARQQISGF